MTTRRSMLEDEDPGLPVKLNPCSNGEFVPEPPTPLVREAVRRARRDAETTARRLGMSRRHFLLSSLGTATTLAAISACAGDQARVDGNAPGGTFAVPPEATTEPDAAYAALGGEELVFDVQTHFLDNNHDIPDLGISGGFPQGRCGEQDVRECYSVDKYLDLLFNKSDTDMFVISALPFAGSPLNPDVMRSTIELADRLCGTGRVFMQGEAHPSNGSLTKLTENMTELKGTMPIAAWKTYTHAGGPGWFLDDHDASAPQVGRAFIENARKLGPKIIAVHKGFSGIVGPETRDYASPVDIGPAAKANPDVTFVVYHSGYDTGNPAERAYDEKDDWGVNRLITSCRQEGIGRGGNVIAELGSTWRTVMGNPTAAAHVVGKLLEQFGEDNVAWGTDSIWYGSPQDQIQAFRAFQISEELQGRYGYPALTPEVKAKILGLNSCRVYGAKPLPKECRIPPEQVEQARITATEGNRTYGPVTPEQVFAVARAELLQFTSFT
jgi:hypothetical protein